MAPRSPFATSRPIDIPATARAAMATVSVGTARQMVPRSVLVATEDRGLATIDRHTLDQNPVGRNDSARKCDQKSDPNRRFSPTTPPRRVRACRPAVARGSSVSFIAAHHSVAGLDRRLDRQFRRPDEACEYGRSVHADSVGQPLKHRWARC